MDASFWLQKWQKNEIAFHKSEANPLFVKHFEKLGVPPEGRVFVPLCGKTLDMAWLLSQGYRVAGAELSEMAVQQFFEGLKVEPEVSTAGCFKLYRAQGIDIFLGNFFDLTPELLGPIDAVYDRAALVALPQAMRERYAAHLKTITGCVPQLLICYVYDQSRVDGPPFSISDEEVRRHYEKDYTLTLLESQDVSGGMKEKCAAQEKVWLLKR